MHEPLHPYTRLLLDSIPQPNPDHRWTDRIEVDETGKELTVSASDGITVL